MAKSFIARRYKLQLRVHIWACESAFASSTCELAAEGGGECNPYEALRETGGGVMEPACL